MPPKTAPKGKPSLRLAVVQAYLAFVSGQPLEEEPPALVKLPADRRLFLHLLKGMVRHRRLLEHELELLAKKPLSRMDAPLVAAAVLGLFQIRHSDRVPHHAAVFETVSLAAPLGFKFAKGWLNGVLRSALRTPPPQPKAQGDTLALATSHPDWMVNRWRTHYGESTALAICQANNRTPTLTLRPEGIEPAELLAKLDAEGLEAKPNPLFSKGVDIVKGGRQALESPLFSGGHCTVQDVSSQVFLAWVLPWMNTNYPGGKVLDVCAAPGGKLTALAKTAPDKEALQAIGGDISPSRITRIKENLLRLNKAHISLALWDATALPFIPNALDVVILDAPCSATGVIQSHPDIKWQKTPEDPKRLALLQKDMLAESARVLRKGGVLCYLTCSLEPEENEQQVAAFLKDNSDFTPLSFLDLPPPPGLDMQAESLVNPSGWLRIFPGEQGTGLFAALFIKNN